ncbi:hypothetical protein R1flu_012434 [Riccia fluitans]|uniref:Uncharacterized protein n=1 Tax=Riccia fluitans TaxID=41844 RepID=A0ABD1ZAM0_9MARC
MRTLPAGPAGGEWLSRLLAYLVPPRGDCRSLLLGIIVLVGLTTRFMGYTGGPGLQSKAGSRSGGVNPWYPYSWEQQKIAVRQTVQEIDCRSRKHSVMTFATCSRSMSGWSSNSRAERSVEIREEVFGLYGHSGSACGGAGSCTQAAHQGSRGTE